MTGPKDLRGLGNNPIQSILDAAGRYLFSPGQTNRAGLSQHHHLIVQELLRLKVDEGSLEDREIARFFRAIELYGYDQGDPVTNGVHLPTRNEDAVRLNSAIHDNNHPTYNKFIRTKILEIARAAQNGIDGGLTEAEAFARGLREVNGLQQWSKWALQAVDADGNPILVLRDNDPRILDGRTAAQINDDAAAKYFVHAPQGSNAAKDMKTMASEDGRFIFALGAERAPLGSYGHALDIKEDGTPGWTNKTHARVKVNDSLVAAAVGEDGDVDPSLWRQFVTQSKDLIDGTVQRLTQILDDLSAKGIDIARRGIEFASNGIKQIEREFVRAYKSVKTKLSQWADFSIDRAKLTLEALDFARDRLPADIHDAFDKSTRKFRDFISKPDGSIDRIRVGAGLATGVLSIANLWVEFARRDYDPDRIADYLKVAAKEAIESLPTVALMVGAAALAGPVGWFSLGAVGGYFAIRTVVSNLVDSELLDKDGVTYKVVKSIDDSLTAFENMVGGYLDQAKKALGEGAELGLEYVTGSAIEWTAEESAAWVGEGNDILVGDDLSMLIGSEENNWLIHRSAGEVYGEDGNDMLIGWLPEEIKEGQIVGVEAGAKSGQWTKNQAGQWGWEEQPLGAATARELREMEKAASEQHKRDVDSGLYSDDPSDSHYKPKPKQIEGVIRAEQDHTLTLDAGAGNDWVITILGEKATTIGGLGRDWIYNTSAEGIIWGDIANSVERSDGSRVAIVDGETIEIADDAANADNFWFASDTTIMDAQKHDRLKLFGITLTGGDTTATSAALGLSVFAGPLAGAGLAGALGAVNLSRAASGAPLIYFDRFVPFITYRLVDGAEAGTKDLIVGNVLDDFLGLIDNPTAPAARGTMRVVDFDRGAGRVFSQAGDLGISLDDINPLAILSLLAPRLQGVPIVQSLMAAFMVSAMAATASYIAGRYRGFAKDNGWVAEGDPLIIDLDGDGIETIGLRDSNAYFDIDGDFFRERTGWLKGDDGFLVLDANANGRIDDISEMFGDRTQLGYAELAAYDTNSDGKISVGDLMWSELKVWQDYDRDGETDAGELKSLSSLGIRELSLGTTALDATTPQGTQLLSFGSVTFENGRVSSMFEATRSRRAAAANDNENDAWRAAAFRLSDGRRIVSHDEILLLRGAA